MDLFSKIQILADSAKYDVSCSSSGSGRKHAAGQIGSALKAGICHSWSSDGRCISLLKILMSNSCIYDCLYCRNRRSSDIQRATLTPEEIVDLTVSFYRRNMIEGLFLSSGIIGDPEKTMVLLTRVAKKLRREEGFNGYIHLKGIPGASWRAIQEAAFYADRMSVNIELPSSQSLSVLAPDKNKRAILTPMSYMGEQSREISVRKDNRFNSFLPAGQTTQMIVGASPESDLQILKLSGSLYKKYQLKRIYYSAYIPLHQGSGAEAMPPLRREHRLYQADWLLRFYQFQPDEVLNPEFPWLDDRIDPKAAWALRNRHLFPVEVNTCSYEMLLRVPGIGVLSAQRIIKARRTGRITFEVLKSIGTVLKRAKYFITCDHREYDPGILELENLHSRLVRSEPGYSPQLELFQDKTVAFPSADASRKSYELLQQRSV